MTDPSLTETAWQRATKDASRVYPSTAFEVAASLATIALGAAAAVASEHSDTVARIAVSVLGGALPLALAFLMVLSFQLLAAPVRQRNELRAAWGVAEPVESINIDLLLRNAHRKGNDLAKLYEIKQGLTRPERDAAEAWADEVVELMTGRASDEATRTFLAAGRDETGVTRRLRLRVDALQQIIDTVG